MRKSIENLAGRKFTGGRIIPNRTRRKYQIDRYPNEAVAGPTKNIVRKVRGNGVKVAFKTSDTQILMIKIIRKLQNQKF